ncbi:MAG: 16S rRNA (cytosine(1402)-N(4))-methyltransferase RsmH [Saprospiraceae bacterium]|nr:16S rRNA (cytosine(1402)-N(4))-methyltransferase RsmH [Saprospiraceae bacterium]
MSEPPVYRHQPVLLGLSIQNLVTDPDGIYVDVTFGGGGHSRKILESLSNRGKLYVFDRDKSAIANIPEDERIEFIHSDFKYLKKYLRYYKQDKVHGILADLGLSSFHLDNNSRGFSYYSSADLDMRMNKDQKLTAKNVIMQYSEKELEQIISEYGELTNSRQIASALVKERQKRIFNSCMDFARWAELFVYGKKQKFLAQLFQAIRMEVNGELESLHALMEQSASCLRQGGRMVVISYHSLEDRVVKKWMRSGNPSAENADLEKIPFRSLYKHALVPDEIELNSNSRSRSAKLRVAEKL